MIQEIDTKRLRELADAVLEKEKVQDIILTRVVSDPIIFEEHKFAKAYEVTRKGKFCGLISISSAIMFIWLCKTPDIEELCSFISFAPITKIGCSKKLYNKIKRRIDFESSLLGKAYYLDKMPPGAEALGEITDNVSEFFDAVKISHKVYEEVEYEQFYCDYFYRKKLPARLYLLKNEAQEVCATCAVMFGYKNTDILSDISTLPEHRRRGYASKLVFRAAGDSFANAKIPSLFCTNPNAMRMYEKMGFKSQQKFYYINL